MIISFQSHFMNENYRKYTQKQDESQAFQSHFMNENYRKYTGLWQFFLSLVLKYLTLNLVESKFFITFVLPNTTVKHVRTN
jgi:hypothetical protein